ncbi:putative cyclase/dehydrase [Gordonia polyisoprenivorans VH2]|uniref:SRPBCC family protein n=2 Tax=Gordonia polyisoprenivorans TaxID=84595 RepID=A0A846WFC9_9ACTN|nr:MULTISPECIES: SRPBCC family protein [Gordonia]AFA71972.1 putative cyclase/dehydrase [Gordonia polyisoprenivorans VH2]MBE7194838.1 SRPBCC family protein [Gordonia polyisoprenivorans]MDF3280764.1 SRPBCC family protein [Gordonia sp. N1V]NKY00148.1 SRPBCC family protein [Gordonia polyisoprenivorans]OPX11890.1 cyclase [Gordonia sp. i37]
MAVSARTEFDVAAPPSVVMEVLMDVESLPEWSGPHKAAAIVSEHDDGTPDQVTMTVSAAGVNDDQTVSYAWTDNTCSWSLIESKMLAEQQGKYTVTPSGDGSHVEFELEIDLKVKLPGMLVKRGQKTAVETAKKGLTAESERRAKA